MSEHSRTELAKSLDKRVKGLLKLGLNLRQVANIVEASYTGLYRAIGGELNYSETTLKRYHASLDAWRKRAASI